MLVSSPQALADALHANPINTVLSCHDHAEVYLSSSTVRTGWYDNSGCSAKVIHCYDDASVVISSGEFALSGDALCVGAGSQIVTQGASFRNNHLNVLTLDSTGRIYVSHSVDTEATTSVAGSTVTGITQVRDEDLTRILGSAKYRYLTAITEGREIDVDLGRFFADMSSAGITSGGVVTATTGLGVRVTDIAGWARRPDSPKFDAYSVVGPAAAPAYTDLTLTANATNYVYYDAANDVVTFNASSAPSYKENLILATVVTGASSIRFLHQTRNLVDKPVERLRERLLQTHDKVALINGLLVTPGTTATTKLSVGDGSYYLGLDAITLDLTPNTDVTFTAFYGTDGATEVTGQTTVDSTNYDNAGTLTAMGAGTFKSDSLVVTSDGKISLIYGTHTYATELLAIDSAFEVVPTILSHSACPIARIIIEQSAGIASIFDARPGGSGTIGAGGGGTVNHDDTTGAAASTVHTAFLKLDGTRAMSGNLAMGSQSITGVNLVDGVDVSDHSALHDPGGADALTMATNANVQSVTADGSNTANVGAVNAFAYATHKHTVTTSATAPTAVATTASAGSGSAVAFANHSHNHGDIAATVGATTYHGTATAALYGFMSPMHYSKVQDDVVINTTDTSIAGRFASFTDTAGKVIADSGYSSSSFSASGHNHTGTYEPVLTKNNLTEATSSVLTIVGGSGAVIGSGTTIQVKAASTTVSGYLTTSDWNTFNNKVTYLSTSTARRLLVWGSTNGKTLAVDNTVIASISAYGGTPGVPTTLTLGEAGASAGQVVLAAATTGNITLQSAASVGTPYTINFPSTVGTSNYVLQGTVAGNVVSLGWVALPVPNLGDVVGADVTGIVDGHIVVYNGTTGKSIKSGDLFLSDLMQLAAVQVVTQKKTFNASTLYVKGASTGSAILAYASTASDFIQTFQAVAGTVYCSNQGTLSQYVSVADGGTGKGSWTVGAVYASSSSVLASETYLNVIRGGTGVGTLPSGEILLGNLTGNITSIAVLTIAKGGTGASSLAAGAIISNGSVLSSSAQLGLTLGGTGAASFSTGVVIFDSGDTALKTSAQLAFSKGGTGASSFSAGIVVYVSGTALTTIASLGLSQGGTGVTSIAAGVVTSNGSALSSVPQLGVSQGGTGAATLASGEILFGAGTSAITSAASLVATKGGTGQTVYVVGDILYASATNALSRLASPIVNSRFLRGGVIAGDFPSYVQVSTADLSTAITSGYVLVASTGVVTGVANTMHIHTTGFGTPNSCTYTGLGALDNATIGDYNTAYGYNSLTGITDNASIGNTCIGAYVGRYITTGNYNLALGYQSIGYSGSYLCTGSYNIAAGYFSLGRVTSGSDNIGIGTSSLTTVSSGANNISLGYQSSYTITTVNYNIAVGYQSGYRYQADNNIGIGYQAGCGVTTGTDNIGVGRSALGKPSSVYTTGSSNIAVGAESLDALTTGYQNVVVGALAGSALSTGYSNCLFGYGSGSLLTTGSYNIGIGSQACYGVTTGVENIAIGYQALGKTAAAFTTGNYNIAIGSSVGISLSSGANNIGIGYGSLITATTGYNNITIGSNSAPLLLAAYGNTVVGTNSASVLAGGYRNVIIGVESAQFLTGNIAAFTGRDNVIIGSGSCSQPINDGNYSLRTGTKNVCIGSDSWVYDTSDNVVVIGYNATGWGSSGITIGSGCSSNGGINIGCTSVQPGPTSIRIGTNGVHTTWYNPAASTTWTSSDKRLKTDITESELGLDFILSLRPVSYRWKRTNADGTKRPSSRKSLGFIAQDVMGLIDNNKFRLVDDPTIDDPNINESASHLSLAYQDLLAPLVKAIQDQHNMIDDLRAEIGFLKGR
jgi:hypothetical protein